MKFRNKINQFSSYSEILTKEKAMKNQHSLDFDMRRNKASSQLTENSIETFPSRMGVRNFLFDDPKQLNTIKQTPRAAETTEESSGPKPSTNLSNLISTINVFKSKDETKKKKKSKRVEALNETVADESEVIGEKPVKKKKSKKLLATSEQSEARETTDGETEKQKKKSKKVALKGREFVVEQQNPEMTFVERLNF